MKYCLAKNGAARYNILIPQNADRDIRFAAEELGKLLKRATLSWFITYDFGDRNVISLGNTELAAKYGLSGDFDELFEHGYRIKTIDGNIFIYAATSIGVINGVYGFLEKTLNYDYFFKDTFYIDRVKEFVIDELDIIDKPDIRERIVSQGFQGSDYEYAELRRFRLIKYRESFPDVFSAGAYHNCFGYLPPSDYFKEHPSWYSDNINTKRANQGQLCYTARGNKKEYELMVEESAKRMFAVFNGNKHDKVVFALNDSWLDWNENCTCSACEKNKEKYGSYVASNILFLKAVGDRVEKMLKNIGDKRAETFLIVFYAYYQLAIPPVNEIFDDKGNKKRDKNGDPCFTFAPELAFGNHLSLVYARGACD